MFSIIKKNEYSCLKNDTSTIKDKCFVHRKDSIIKIDKLFLSSKIDVKL